MTLNSTIQFNSEWVIAIGTLAVLGLIVVWLYIREYRGLPEDEKQNLKEIIASMILQGTMLVASIGFVTWIVWQIIKVWQK